MENNTRLSANTEPQLLLQSGPMLIREFNPKGVLRFTGRKCITCNTEILDHWLRSGSADYWCAKDGDQASDGITDCTIDIPEGFGNGI